MSAYSDACQAAQQALRDAGISPAQASAAVAALEGLIEAAMERKFAAVAAAASQPPSPST